MAVITGDAQLPPEALAQAARLQKQAGKGQALDLIALGGTSGLLRVWCVDPLRGAGECIWRDQLSRATFEGRNVKYTEQIEGLSWCAQEGMLACVTSAQNICFYDFKSASEKVIRTHAHTPSFCQITHRYCTGGQDEAVCRIFGFSVGREVLR